MDYQGILNGENIVKGKKIKKIKKIIATVLSAGTSGFGKLKEKREKIKKYRVDTENLAVPETHIHRRRKKK